MPGFDRTGPAGGGPMTGRGQGRCEGTRGDRQTTDGGFTGYGNQYGFGRGGNRGFGAGRGRRSGFFSGQQPPRQPIDTSGEVEALKIQVKRLQQSLDAVLQKAGAMNKND